MAETFDIKWDKNLWEPKEKETKKEIYRDSDEYRVLSIFKYLDLQTVYNVIKIGFIQLFDEQIDDVTLKNLLTNLVDMKLLKQIDNPRYPEGLYEKTALGKKVLKHLENHLVWSAFSV